MIRAFLATAALLLTAFHFVGAQAPPKEPSPPAAPTKKSPLEEALAAAMKHNPDIRVSESKVREAEAELNRARMAVTQRIVKLHQAIETHKVLAEVAEKQLADAEKMHANGIANKQTVETAQQAVRQAKMKLAELEGDLGFAIGKSGEVTSASVWFSTDSRLVTVERGGTIHLWDVGQLVIKQGQIAESMRAALDRATVVKFQDKPMSTILAELQEKNKGIQFLNLANVKDKITLELKQEVPLAAALQALEDATGLRFAIRDYGILLVTPDKFPAGAVSPHDYWKTEPKKEGK